MIYEEGFSTRFNPDNYDMVVVGAGLAGCTIARNYVEALGKRVCVVERRNHVSGNAYDSLDDAGILIHNYGPHIFHTTSKRVYEFLSRFTEWNDYDHKVLANVHGQLMPVPFNHKSLLMAFGDERGEALYQKLIATFGSNVKVPLMELRQQGDPDLTEIADYVYENVFLHYTMKQWGKTPDEIDPAITARVPIFLGDDDRYFPGATYQGMPHEGYTKMVERMLDHDMIDVYCGVDIRPSLEITKNGIYLKDKPFAGELIYTGPLDELFDLDMGALPYRTLDMQFETLDEDSFQPVATVNYTTSEDFTRITEFKKLTAQEVANKTTIMREYPMAYDPDSDQTPYYAILEEDNIALYNRYLDRVRNIVNFHPVGRLAEYRYYDMDAVVLSALELSDEIINQR